jgi:hypothetical protein
MRPYSIPLMNVSLATRSHRLLLSLFRVESRLYAKLIHALNDTAQIMGKDFT